MTYYDAMMVSFQDKQGETGAEMKQRQVETVTITLCRVTMPGFFTYNLVEQYNTPSYIIIRLLRISLTGKI